MSNEPSDIRDTVYRECQSERIIAHALRETALEIIEQYGKEESAKILGLKPSGVDTLIWNENWAIDKALRIVEIFGIDPISIIQTIKQRAIKGESDE